MRRLSLLIAGSALLLSACAAGASPTPSPATPSQVPTPEATPTWTATPPPPTASPAIAVQAQVSFDGQACRYLGPMVVPSHTRATIDFTVDADAPAVAFAVAPVFDGTTWQDVLESAPLYPPSSGGYPPFLVAESLVKLQMGPGTMVVDFVALTRSHLYSVVCLSDPETDDTAYPAALIEVLPD